ncbi:MAG: hypothetical protein ACREHV_07740 [Rhizomicrobium sp.]
MKTDFGMRELLDGDPIERARKRFLKSRVMEWKGEGVVTPLIELANHAADGLAYASGAQHRLEIRGTAQDEILVDYGRRDLFLIFRIFGFAVRQPQAYSVPMRARLDGMEILIGRNTTVHSRRGPYLLPRTQRDGNNLVLSYLTIGSPKTPRLPREIFQILMREAGAQKPDRAFDHVLHYNRRKFLDLLAALEAQEGPMILTLRRMALCQLETMVTQ